MVKKNSLASFLLWLHTTLLDCVPECSAAAHKFILPSHSDVDGLDAAAVHPKEGGKKRVREKQ